MGHIYAQRVNSSGGVEWVENGVEICTYPQHSIPLIFPQLCSDGDGGAIITWETNRDDNAYQYAQRVNSTGDVQWKIDGIEICTLEFDSVDCQISSDGNGGALIIWGRQLIENAKNRLYAQRVDSLGNILWTASGY